MDDVRMLPLAELLALHDAHQPEGALDRCLGDGYLLARNSVHRSIRAAACNLGARYTTEDYCHYNALRISSLDAILTAGRIPYCDNVTILRELERHRTGRFRLHHVFELNRNYVLHESAHFVADRLYRPDGDVPAGTDPELAVTRGMMLGVNLAESFANAVELVARFAIETEIDDRILDQNTNMRVRPEIAPAFRELVAHVGTRAAFVIVLLGYMHTNMLHDALPPDRLAIVLELAECEPDALALAIRVLPACFKLNAGFRQLTQAFYLTYRGIETPLDQLVAFDFLSTILGSDRLRRFIARLAEVIDDRAHVTTAVAG
jgi:hypothetical protein